MASIRGRLDKLQQESEGLFHTLTLEDGTKVRYEPEELLDAIFATIAGEEHPLLPYVRREGARGGLAGLINAVEASQERCEGGDRDGD